MADTVREQNRNSDSVVGLVEDKKPSPQEVKEAIERILKNHKETFDLLADS